MNFGEEFQKEMLSILMQAYDLTMEEITKEIDYDINRAAEFLSKEEEPRVMLRALGALNKLGREELLVQHAALLIRNAKTLKAPEVSVNPDTIEPGHIDSTEPVDGNPTVNEWK